MSKYDEWKDRKAGFDEQVNIVKNLRVTEDLKMTEDLVELTDSLYEFTTELFCFFLNGFREFLGFDETQDQVECKDDHKSTTKLIPSMEYPPEYVLQKILRQASFDLTVIQRIFEERNRNNKELLPDLKKYDKLALSALSIAFPDPENYKKGVIDPVKPFVYFQRDISVRIIPYANTLLIGVPFSTSRQPIDLLSIPHEIGHYIYETGRFSETEPISLFFEKYFADQDDWIRNWLEEIFADLYGFLVAGPIVAFSLQEILLDNFPSSLWEDDGDHPAGIIRPLIFSELFNSAEFNNGDFEASDIAVKLATKWDQEGKKRGFARQFRSATENQVIDQTEATNTLGCVLKKMYDKMNAKTQNAFDFPASLNLNKNLQAWKFFPTKVPSIPKNVQIDSEAPFANFDVDKVIDWQEDKIAKMQKILVDPKLNFELSRKDRYAYWLTDQIDYWEKHKPEVPPLPPNVWKLIFTAFSWADKPDDTRPVKGPENIRY